MGFLVYGSAYIDSNVGIGTIAPGNPLQVYSTGAMSMKLQTTGSFNPIYISTDPNRSYDWGTYSDVGDNFVIHDATAGATAYRLTIDHNGNVGIVTSTPKIKLTTANK